MNNTSRSMLIGTPAYNGLVHTDYLHTLLGFSRIGITYSVMTVGNESLITRARNHILSKFIEIESLTHLLFLDADIHLKAEDMNKLIAHNKDVIGAPVPLKDVLPDNKRRFNIGEILSQEGDLAQTTRLGTAVFMLSRQAALALVEDAKANDRVYQGDPGARGEAMSATQYDVFGVGVIEGVYLSEDYWVCRRLIELGFTVHVDLSIQTRHNGMYVF